MSGVGYEPLVSFVTPTYNRAYCLGNALNSVLTQSYRRVEVIVVDDGSEDETRSVVASLGDPRVRYFRMDRNEGHPVRMKFGMQQAQGDLYAKLDSDDMLADDRVVEDTVTLFASLPRDVWVVTYPVQCTAGYRPSLAFSQEILDLPAYLGHPYLLSQDFMHICNRAFLEEFLRFYVEPYNIYTAKFDVYLRNNCRQVLVPRLGLIMGFYGDNVTKRPDKGRYELWRELAAIHRFHQFRDYAPAWKTDWWRDRLLSTMFWSLAGQSRPFRGRATVALDALKEYRRHFGIDIRSVLVIAGAALPFKLGRRLRRWRCARRKRRQ